jgi:GT2 family glycosyltransferase
VGLRDAECAGAAYVWVLTDDIAVAPNALTELIAAMSSDARIGLVTPLVYYSGGGDVVWYGGGYHTRLAGRAWHRGHGEHDTGQFRRVEDVGYALGVSLVRVNAVEEVGFMDERFFLYWEDADWSRRMIAGGWRVVLAPTAHVWHRVNAAGGKQSVASVYYITRNHLLHYSTSQRYRLPFAIGFLCLQAAKSRLRGRRDDARFTGLGIRDFLQGRTGRMPEEYELRR